MNQPVVTDGPTPEASKSIVPSSPSSANQSNQMELFYKLKNEIDLLNKQINLQSNLLCLVERRKSYLLDNNNDSTTKVNSKSEFDRNYRYWRRKLSKLKIDRKKLTFNVNLYDLLYDLYQHLQVCQVKSIAVVDNVVDSKQTNILITEKDIETDQVTTNAATFEKPKRKYVTKRSMIQQKSSSSSKKLKEQESNEDYVDHHKLFKCHFCLKRAKSKRSLVAHMVQAHKDQNIHFCDIDGCRERFSSPTLLRRHKLEHHKNVIECKKCHKFFKNRTILSKHRLAMHKLVCVVGGCAKTCSTKRQMQQHLTNHLLPIGADQKSKRSETRKSATTKSQPKRSNNTISDIDDSKKKKYNVKPKKTFQCPKCSRTFTKTFDFKTHLKAVDCTKVWCCHVENCPEMFYKLKFLTEHCLTVHQEPVRFRCSWPGCNKMCNENRRLKSHYRVHTGERPYQCNWPGCDKRFKTSSCLCGHLKQHKNELNYSCSYPDCDYKANTNCTMRSHIRIKHEKKYYKRNRKKATASVVVVEADATAILVNNENGIVGNLNQLNSSLIKDSTLY